MTDVKKEKVEVENINPAEIERVDVILSRPVEEITTGALSEHVVPYLRKMRDNIRAAESAGKRPTAKAARTKPTVPNEGNILDALPGAE